MSLIINPYAHGSASSGPYACDSADFDGDFDYLRRVGGITGATDSKLLTFSFWMNVDDFIGDVLSWANSLAGPPINMRWTYSSGQPRIIGDNASGAEVFDIIANAGGWSGFSTGTWNHVLGSVDLADTSKRHLYINDVNRLHVFTYTNNTIDFTKADLGIGAACNGDNKIDGRLADVWVDYGTYINFADSNNRRKFISAAGKPVNLGANGELPTGAAPEIFLHLDDGQAAVNFATNRGTGGGFTVTGALSTGATSPSD